MLLLCDTCFLGRSTVAATHAPAAAKHLPSTPTAQHPDSPNNPHCCLSLHHTNQQAYYPFWWHANVTDEMGRGFPGSY